MNKLEKIENAVKAVVTVALVVGVHIGANLGDKELFYSIGVVAASLTITALVLAVITAFTPLGDWYKRTVRPKLLKRWKELENG